MVRYSLTCAEGHAFDSWFASASAFDDLAGRGLLACAACGSGRVAKALMAPAVATSRPAPAKAEPSGDGPPKAEPQPRPLSGPRDARGEALARLRREVEAGSDYVGLRFAAEARRLHEAAQAGEEAPARPIWGEARPEEARALIEDGIPVAPLPFRPRRSTH